MDNVINLFHRDILTLRSHHWKYFMNTYTGCSYCCAYCLNAYTNDFYKKIKIDENMQTSINKVFAGGDIVGQKATVAWASRSGRDAAEKILKIACNIM